MDVILKFSGPYEFLSNFYPCKIVCGVNQYPTVEHAYQSAKTLIPTEKAKILSAATPSKAKQLGQVCTLRRDWEAIKVRVMLSLLEEKFGPGNPQLSRSLELTYPAILIEGNHWHDNVWGVCFCDSCPGRGGNLLGELLMDIRCSVLSSEGDF